jgi:hypothetical protein
VEDMPALHLRSGPSISGFSGAIPFMTVKLP